MHRLQHYLLVYLKGVAMGAADVVPGVSGGTIAFVSGIYIELIDSIKSLNLQAVRALRTGGIGAAWKHINGNFLVALLAGIATSVLSLARLVQQLLQDQPLLIWSFFFGLVAGSIIYLLRQHPTVKIAHFLLFATGALFALGIGMLVPVESQGGNLALFGAGSLALCAMILPGISGSFILVLLGFYPIIIDAVVGLHVNVLAIFAAGGIVGLMLFSRLLSWLLHHFQEEVMITMSGFLLGSLSIIWPWKEVLSSMISHSGKTIVLESRNLLPERYAQVTHADPQTWVCLALMLVGLALVLGLEFLGARYRRTHAGVS